METREPGTPVPNQRHATGWETRAACRGIDPKDADRFHGDVEAQRSAIREYCWTCPVAQDCLRYSKEAREQWGVWGGLTEAVRPVIHPDLALRVIEHRRQSNPPPAAVLRIPVKRKRRKAKAKARKAVAA